MKKIIIALTLVIAIAIALSVTIPTLAATNSDTTTVTGTIGTAIDVTSTAATTLPLTAEGTVQSGTITVTVKCNVGAWHVAVTTNNSGYMKGSGTPDSLGHKLQVAGGDLGPTGYVDADIATLQTETVASAGTTTISDVSFQQETTYADPASDYAILVTFTGTTD